MDKFEWPPHSDEFVSIRVAIFSELLLRYEFIRHNFNQGHKKSTSRLDCRFQLRYQKAFSPIIKFDYLSRVSRVKWSHRLNKRVRPHPTEDLNLETKTFNSCYDSFDEKCLSNNYAHRVLRLSSSVRLATIDRVTFDYCRISNNRDRKRWVKIEKC